jgi:general secretion pathway protein G
MKRIPRLAELATLFAVIVFVLYFIYFPGTEPGVPQRAIESVLKQDLSIMRQSIGSFATDMHHAPTSLQDLVDAHYLREIPVDPITRKSDGVVHLITDPKTNVPQLEEVHSNSSKKATDGSRYDTW